MQNYDKIGAKIGATPPFHSRLSIVAQLVWTAFIQQIVYFTYVKQCAPIIGADLAIVPISGHLTDNRSW